MADLGGASGDSGGTSAGGGGMQANSGGTGGIPTGGQESLFDDFNDGNATINITDGRFGVWNAYTDGTEDATMTPGPGDPFVTSEREPENQALRVTATGFAAWGIGLYASFDDDGGGDPPELLEAYDLPGRGYDAVRFWAKKEASSNATTLGIRIADDASTLASEGGSCPAPPDCAYDHARADVILTTEWTEYTVLLSSFQRTSTADPVDFSKSFQLHVVQLGQSIDFWIDDIRLVDFDL
jgi:hypothetical protein